MNEEATLSRSKRRVIWGDAMKQILRYRPSPATAIAVTALLVAVGGVAYATIPDSSGTIHGCFNTKNGNLRVVESAGNCRSNERTIDWNQEGPPGPPGGLTTEFAEETPEVSTTSRSFVDLGGPSVNVTVPPSGLVAVVARAEIHGTLTPPTIPGNFASILEGCLGLFVDSQPHTGSGDSGAELLCSRGDSSLGGGPPFRYLNVVHDWFTFEASPGSHTVSIRYRSKCVFGSVGCPAEDRAFFKNRKFWVIPIG